MTHRWSRDAVLYQVYPRSFADANGDGIGDLAGGTDRARDGESVSGVLMLDRAGGAIVVPRI